MKALWFAGGFAAAMAVAHLRGLNARPWRSLR